MPGHTSRVTSTPACLAFSAKRCRVRQQNLARADLDEQRRQPAQVREERRGERRTRIGSPQVDLHGLAFLPLLDHHVLLCVENPRFAGVREVGVGRQAHRRGRQGPAVVAKKDEQRQGEIPSRRVARQHDLTGCTSLGQQPLVGGHRILERRRERVLRGQAVVDQQGAGPGGKGDVAGEGPVADDRPGVERSAMQEEDNARRLYVLEGRSTRQAPRRPRRGRTGSAPMGLNMPAMDSTLARSLATSRSPERREKRFLTIM